ncbi:CDP-diacylglycerol-glycerol-3-phosphate 3-phosphatidyltransferase [Dentipellis sp. KUC8613]|nr:CDP-diacylglycerol-glycerol-3-phosphate 3-phosphatidyltransferase [Dentipellis sp. KUC8613]
MFALLRARQSTHLYSTLASNTRRLSLHASSNGAWSTALHPCIRDFASSLAQTQPCFSVSSNKIRVLYEPHDFYSNLLDMIRRARRRIFISSLYIGSSEKELIETLRDALTRNPELDVFMQLDLNRSTRPGPSTVRLLAPLLKDYPERLHVSLFRSPKLKGVMASLVPPRFNEGWGTWHAKIYGADDDVMISGANLNKSYFQDRQDRYIEFTSSPELADYCKSFLETVSTFSYKVAPPSGQPPILRIKWTDKSTRAQYIEKKAGAALVAFQESQREKSALQRAESERKDEVLVYPILQGGQFGVREEEHCLRLLFDHINEYVTSAKQSPDGLPLVDLTSGYFGLYNPYQKLILDSPANTRIICASPKANGFYDSSGISGRIPEGYTLLEQRFMSAVRAAGRNWSETSNTGVELSEWHRDGWTYHAKGIWLSPTPTSPPVLTLFGSTNLNSRSSHLDTELSFVMLTSSPDLQAKLQGEVQRLRAHAGPWQGGKRPVRLGTKAIVGVVGGML